MSRENLGKPLFTEPREGADWRLSGVYHSGAPSDYKAAELPEYKVMRGGRSSRWAVVKNGNYIRNKRFRPVFYNTAEAAAIAAEFHARRTARIWDRVERDEDIDNNAPDDLSPEDERLSDGLRRGEG